MNAAAALLAAVEIGDPLTRGSLALFPLFHELAPARHYISGPRAPIHMEVSEVDGGVVEQLDIGNESDWPILFIDGETLIGARQNRIVTTSVLVPPRRHTRVAVTCVEQGRWGEERVVGRSPRHAPPGVRARNLASVTDAVVAGRPVENDQAGVWDEVRRYATVSGAASDTGAMEDVHDHVAGRVHALVGDTRPLPGQCGVAAAIGARVIAVDLFDNPETLADYWDALVAGFALDAQAERAAHPRRRDVRRVLAAVAAGRDVTADGRVHIAAEGMSATALMLDDAVVHLAVTPSTLRFRNW